ncbi:10918_t:CDS:2 [Gigaspora rosea]|nr:10918_t:CDS:2 [Gigaspora rosea]
MQERPTQEHPMQEYSTQDTQECSTEERLTHTYMKCITVFDKRLTCFDHHPPRAIGENIGVHMDCDIFLPPLFIAASLIRLAKKMALHG